MDWFFNEETGFEAFVLKKQSFKEVCMIFRIDHYKF